ncbi:hypothetical protein PAPHI01_0618 [Pancytospora philotis]|nr:hypothetical protein PAPHI01_0618 [Pancytospora philotis]
MLPPSEKRIEDLIKEIKQLRSENDGLRMQKNSLNIRLHTAQTQLEEAQTSGAALGRRLQLVEEESRLLYKRFYDKIKQLKIEMRQKDVFRTLYRGSSKTSREAMANSEMEKLQAVNRTLLAFVELLGQKFNFDADTAHRLCEAVRDIDDPVIRTFIDGMRADASYTRKHATAEKGAEDPIAEL